LSCFLALPLMFSLFFFTATAAPRDLHSFPTRRSSDLIPVISTAVGGLRDLMNEYRVGVICQDHTPAALAEAVRELCESNCHEQRSEEHMSELQSRENLVCRLLLEKKKTTQREY